MSASASDYSYLWKPKKLKKRPLQVSPFSKKPPERSLPKRATMYRLFDASGVLLYVGCTTVDLAKRLSAHHCQTLPWWSNVARTEQTQYERHEDALLAERRAIWHERPAGAQLDTQQGREHQARTME